MRRAGLKDGDDIFVPSSPMMIKDMPPERLQRLAAFEESAGITLPRDAFLVKSEATGFQDSRDEYWIYSPTKVEFRELETVLGNDYRLVQLSSAYQGGLPKVNFAAYKQWSDSTGKWYEVTLARTERGDYFSFAASTS